MTEHDILTFRKSFWTALRDTRPKQLQDSLSGVSSKQSLLSFLQGEGKNWLSDKDVLLSLKNEGVLDIPYFFFVGRRASFSEILYSAKNCMRLAQWLATAEILGVPIPVSTTIFMREELFRFLCITCPPTGCDIEKFVRENPGWAEDPYVLNNR